MKPQRLDRDGGAAPCARSIAVVPAAMSIWLTTQPPKTSPPELVSARIGTVCSVSVPCGVRATADAATGSDKRRFGGCTQFSLAHAIGKLEDLKAARNHLQHTHIGDDQIDHTRACQRQGAGFQHL